MEAAHGLALILAEITVEVLAVLDVRGAGGGAPGHGRCP
jgi:hypothetical protein